jgi:hypothetical protein
MVIGVALLLVGVAACRPMGVMIRTMESDRTLKECYRVHEGELKGEIHLSATGSTLKATLVATRGALNDPSFPRMQWKGTGHRTDDDRIELVLDRTAYDSVYPSRVQFNADIFNEGLRGFLFDPSLDQLYESMTMYSCYGAGDVRVRIVPVTTMSGAGG